VPVFSPFLPFDFILSIFVPSLISILVRRIKKVIFVVHVIKIWDFNFSELAFCIGAKSWSQTYCHVTDTLYGCLCFFTIMGDLHGVVFSVAYMFMYAALLLNFYINPAVITSRWTDWSYHNPVTYWNTCYYAFNYWIYHNIELINCTNFG
jgi:hypothetical protein